MSHSEQTLYYGLPKYVGTDIINPLTDFNDAADAIDTALYDANTASASAVQTAQGAVEEVGTYDARITSAQEYAEDAISKANNTMDMIAEEFNPLKTGGYKIGDTCIYNEKLYEFINVHTGAWDAGDVKQTVITEAVESTIEQGKAEIAEETQEAMAEIAGQTQKVTATQEMISHLFDETHQYYRSDLCYYADKLYRFTSDHLGAWTGTDVSETDISQVIRLPRPAVLVSIPSAETTWADLLPTLASRIDFKRITNKSKIIVYCERTLDGVVNRKTAQVYNCSDVTEYSQGNDSAIFTLYPDFTTSFKQLHLREIMLNSGGSGRVVEHIVKFGNDGVEQALTGIYKEANNEAIWDESAWVYDHVWLAVYYY